MRCLVAALLFVAATATADERVLHYTVFVGPRPGGQATLRIGKGGTRRVDFDYRDRGLGPTLHEELAVGKDGLPARVRISGSDGNGQRVDERFVRTTEHGFYLSPSGTPEELAALVRAMRAHGGALPVLPDAHAALIVGETVELRRDRARAKVRLFEISAPELGPPLCVWLDEDGELFATGETIRAGWEASAPELEGAEKSRARARAAERLRLAPRLAHPLAFVHAALFEAESRTIRAGITVVVDGDAITAVGADGRVAIPADAERIDARGKTLVPGLWDLHAHVGDDDGLMLLAAGVTSIRMIGGPAVIDRARAFSDGNVLGPRALAACVVDGHGANQSPTTLLVADEKEARAAVDRCAALGFVQVKMYNSLPAALVPAIVDEAHRRGLRVSGHVPDGMKALDLVADGVDEIQHAYFVLLQLVREGAQTPEARFRAFAEQAGAIEPSSAPFRALVDALAKHHVAVDLTLVSGEQLLTARPGRISPVYAAVAERLPAQLRRALSTGGMAPAGHEAAYARTFAATLALAAALARAGVPLAVGTDEQLYGFSLHRELELYVQAGIAPADALYDATLGAARLMKRDRELGSIAVGKRADLVLVDGDPTRDISVLRLTRLVLSAGRRIDPPKLLSAAGIRP